MVETNPYNITRPVTDPKMFFGRQTLLKQLIEGLTADSPKSYAVYGGRRTGKTSLMRMIERRLNERLDTDARPVVVPLYMDLQFDPPSTLADFFQRLLNRLSAWQTGAGGESKPLLLGRDVDPAPGFAEAFIKLDNRARPTLGGVKLALLVDESEELQRPDWARGLEDNLRALLSNVPGVTGHLGLVMTGGVDFYSEMVAEQDASPLRNVLDEEIKLTGCAPEEVARLVNEPTGGQLPNEVAAEVVRQAGGHLFLAQYLMKHLWDMGLEEADQDLVKEIAGSFPELRRDYEGWQRSIDPTGCRAYALLVQSELPMSRREIREKLDLDNMAVNKALDRLVFHNLIIADKREATWHGEMFRAWFMENVLPTLKELEAAPGEKAAVPAGAPKYIINITDSPNIAIGDNTNIDQQLRDDQPKSEKAV